MTLSFSGWLRGETEAQFMPAVAGKVEGEHPAPSRRSRRGELDGTGGRREFTWMRELTGTPNGDAPVDLNTSCTYTAEAEMPPLRPTILHRKTASGDGSRNQQSARRALSFFAYDQLLISKQVRYIAKLYLDRPYYGGTLLRQSTALTAASHERR
jgi:hypothetical protein